MELLGAARELFFREGYRATTIQQIAASAGYSKRTVYLDFETKDELFITLCAEGGELILEALAGIDAERLSVEELIDAFGELFIDFSRRHGEYFRMIFSEATAEIIGNCTAALRDRVARLERDCLCVVVAWVERAVGEGLIPKVDPWETAGILVGAATGIILLSMGGSQTVYSQRTREVLVRQAVRTFWRGLRCEEPSGASPSRRPLPSMTLQEEAAGAARGKPRRGLVKT
ncbi:MAG: TetR/AcrR family transcriptional regulator [Polyangia bacterium]|jgi:AcrR family transcriptional regulator|nr:TetR/AcrR family transcriptional regulator [Polyangia bacterium]